MSETLSVKFAEQSVNLILHGNSAGLVNLVVAFFKPHFSVVSIESSAATGLPIDIYDIEQWVRPFGAPRRTVVRKGRSAETNVWGELWIEERHITIEITSSQTVFRLAKDGSRASVFVSSTSRYHLSDFLREVMWELAVASGAGIFIHAAAVSIRGTVVALVGDKGAGKTTTAIDLVRDGADFYSGDILFTTVDGSRVYSYPDYPGVCWGTIRANPELYSVTQKLGLAPSNDDNAKVLLPHDVYLTAFGVEKAVPPLPLGAIVVADVPADGPGRIELSAPRWDLLKSLDRSASDPEEGWEPFLVEVVEQYKPVRSGNSISPLNCGAPWYVRRGQGHPAADEIARLFEDASAASRSDDKY